MRKEIAKQIREIRVSLGLKQREIAAKINLKQTSYANYEYGRAMPPADIYLKILALVNKTPDLEAGP